MLRVAHSEVGIRKPHFAIMQQFWFIRLNMSYVYRQLRKIKVSLKYTFRFEKEQVHVVLVSHLRRETASGAHQLKDTS